MGQILVISDNEILNQLYITNLEVYLGAKVILVESIALAFEKLKTHPCELVVVMSMMNGIDTANEMYNHLNEKKYKSKLIIIGNPLKELADAVVVSNSYHLQNLIRSCALVLGITAKDMADKPMPLYYQIDGMFLSRLREVPCAVYIQLKNSQYTLVAKKGDLIGEKIKHFANEGITTFYVNSQDRLQIVNVISTSIVDFLKSTEGLDIEIKSDAVREGFLFTAANFSESTTVTSEIMDIANACTKVMEEIVNEAPSLKKLLTILNTKKDGFIYTHSILAAYVSNHIIRRVSWGGESHLEKINFVLFFHDIMLAPIYLNHPNLKYEEDLLFSDELSDKEKETVLNHARLSAELIVTYKRAPIGADLLIKQHHGITNGIGFAMEYKDDVSPLSKIVLIAEAFIDEFMKNRDENPNYQLDKKKIIEILNEKFKRTTYKKIIETLESFPA
jgi:response regulator RpfG family c-di-GMP phosphodiesterase